MSLIPGFSDKAWDKTKDFLFGTSGVKPGDEVDPNAKLYQDRLNALYAEQQGPAAIDRSRIDAILGNQGQLATQLQGMANGQGGAGTMAAQRAVLTGQRNLQSMAASQRGITAGSSMREAARQSAILAAEGAGQVGQVRAQEQEQALGQLQGLYGQQAGLEAGMAGMQQQADQARLQNLMAITAQQSGMSEAELLRKLGIQQQSATPGMAGPVAGALATIFGGPIAGQVAGQVGGGMARAF